MNDVIEQLRLEAAEAGDLAQVYICDRALDGDKEALAECARVIQEAYDALDPEDRLYAERTDDTWTVVDPSGGRWWPDDETRATLEMAPDPEDLVVRIATNTPGWGEWRT